MEPRISLITLGVRDLERSVAFYRDGLGLPGKEFSDNIVFFTLQGTWLSLYPRDDLADDAGVTSAGSGFSGFTLAHNVHSREEVDALLKQAVKAGGKTRQAGPGRVLGRLLRLLLGPRRLSLGGGLESALRHRVRTGQPEETLLARAVLALALRASVRRDVQSRCPAEL